MSANSRGSKFDWVKRLGQGHISGPGSTTLCGMPKLGNNYAGHIKVKYPCQECIDTVPTVTEHPLVQGTGVVTKITIDKRKG